MIKSDSWLENTIYRSTYIQPFIYNIKYIFQKKVFIIMELIKLSFKSNEICILK